MGAGRKNKLSAIIKYELLCLAAVSLIVFGTVRWSEGRRNAARTEAKLDSQAEEITGAPEVSGVPEKNTDGAGIAEPTDMPGDEPGNAGGTAAAATAPAAEPGTAAEPEPTTVTEPGTGDAPEGSVPVFNNSAEMDLDFIRSLAEPQPGEILEAAGAVTTTYYLQTDPRWGSLFYGGEDTIAKYACGPTSMAIVVSSLTDIKIDPVQMSGWACDNGYWYEGSGSLHTIVNGTAKAFGLESEGVGNDSATAQKVIDNLKEGGMAVALMGKGHFTKSGHFIVLRGITEEGKILVADCNSRDNTLEEWDMETLQAEAKYAADGGPFWIIRNPNTIE